MKQQALLSDIRIGSDKGVLRLQFSTNVSRSVFGKERFYQSLGKVDTPENRDWANAIILRIQKDIDHPDHLFDPTLQKYLGAKVIQLPNALRHPTLLNFWDDFCEWKLSTGQISRTTYLSRHRRTFQNWLKPYLGEEISRELANKIGKELGEADNYKPNLKKLFSALIEAGDRAVRLEILPKNFFLELKEINFRIKKKSKQLENEEDFRAFTLTERNNIINAFYNSDSSAERQIATLVEFLFLTGCRLGEAFAFKWKDVKDNWIVFDESYSSESRITKSTKTDTIRIFKLQGYSSLINLLDSLRRERTLPHDPNDFVFIKQNGQPYKRLNLSSLWLGSDKSKDGGKYYHDGVITRLVKLGLVKQYLKPSSTRHTFITLQAQNGVDLGLLADTCGNSIDVIYNHYLGRNRESKLLDI